MRTTVEITDAQRARLLDIAARRRLKGFSGLVQEAIDLYLASDHAQAARIDAALGVLGTLDERAAKSLVAAVETTRRRWR